MEYLQEGDLTKYIGKSLPQETVKTISVQILEGLKIMHEEGMAHRDVKPSVSSLPPNKLSYVPSRNADECIEYFCSF